MNRNTILKILIIVCVTAFLGELKITPFNSSFRIALGSAGFFFLLLYYKDVPYLLTGFVTGVLTTLFRTGLDSFYFNDFSFIGSFLTHSPIIGYYLVFATILQFTKRKCGSISPLMLGFFGVLSDGIANIAELLLHSAINGVPFMFSNIGYVFIVAVFRSFFVIGLYNSIESNKLKAIYVEQRKKFEEIQTILSELYIEGFYLEKTLTDIETITRKAHDLYQELKKLEMPVELTRSALLIAQEVHEVKKDNQRIKAGLEKLIAEGHIVKPVSLKEIVNVSLKANKKYSKSLGKNIEIEASVDVDLKVQSIYPLLIILNNLITNAIEAIDETGFIQVTVRMLDSNIIIEVLDNGPGIDSDEQDVIFEPGFTTKFTETGKPSTGIGLSHVKLMVEKLDGSIQLQSSPVQTTFTITLPIKNL